jgi:putative ABC transport system permease protein
MITFRTPLTLRSLARVPAFTLASVLTLAVATAVIVTTFSLVYGILLRELPYPNADRLVLVKSVYGAGDDPSAAVSPPDFGDRRNARSFSAAALWKPATVNITEGEPESLDGVQVTGQFFDLLGIARPALRSDTDQLFISDRLWRRRFGARANIIGSTLRIDDKQVVIAGVMPRAFAFPNRGVDVWLPFPLRPADLADANRGNEYAYMIARLRHGVSPAAAQAEMNVISAWARERVPERKQFLLDSKWRVELYSLTEDTVGRFRPALLLLFGAAGLVLLLAVANVSGLFLARTVGRARELSVRAALGAGRMRIAGALAAEVAAVTMAGGAIGLAAAKFALPFAASTGLPRATELGIDATVVTFAGAALIVIAASITLLIAFMHSRTDSLVLRERSTTVAGARLRTLLVALQVAIAVTLVASGALLSQSYRRLRGVETGFDPRNVLTFRVKLPATVYDTADKRRAFFDRLQSGLRNAPGVTGASAISNLPFTDNWTISFMIEGRPPATGVPQPGINIRLVLPEYAAAMKIPLLRGRSFDARDRGSSPKVVIIDEAAARKWWPNEDPVGKRITFSDASETPLWREIVGVVGAVRHESLSAAPEPHVYLPLLQSASQSEAVYVVRGGGELTNSVRAIVKSIDPAQPIYGIRTMQQTLDDASAQPRLRALLVTIFASIGVLLASVGLYALLAYVVASRTREVGVRMALGATRSQVVRFVVRWSFRVTLAGIVAGLGGALVMTRSMRALLFGIDPFSPATYLAVAAAFLGVAMIASVVPALRAARIDPATALKQE